MKKTKLRIHFFTTYKPLYTPLKIFKYKADVNEYRMSINGQDIGFINTNHSYQIYGKKIPLYSKKYEKN